MCLNSTEYLDDIKVAIEDEVEKLIEKIDTLVAAI